MTIDGTGYIKHKGIEKTVTKNDVLLIDCNQYQYYGTFKDSWTFKWLLFAGNSGEIYYKLINKNSFQLINTSKYDNINTSLNTILCSVSEDNFNADIKISAKIMTILTELILISSTIKESTNPEITACINHVIEYIKENYTLKLHIEDLAGLLHLSPHYFAHLFKKHVGMGPHEYLTKYRINQSKELLKHSSASVEQIALKIGFENVNNYIRNFDKFTGSTPLNYRRFRME